MFWYLSPIFVNMQSKSLRSSLNLATAGFLIFKIALLDCGSGFIFYVFAKLVNLGDYFDWGEIFYNFVFI